MRLYKEKTVTPAEDVDRKKLGATSSPNDRQRKQPRREAKSRGKTGNENIDKIIACSRFAKLRQQLLRSSNFQNSGRIATQRSDSSQPQCQINHDKLHKDSSSSHIHADNNDYNPSIPAEFLPTHGLPFTLRSSSLGFSQKSKTLVENDHVGYKAKGRSSLSVPLGESKATNGHRVRFVTEAASEDNIMSRKENILGYPQVGISADDKKRQVIISSLPTETTFSDIFSIIWGGKVESVEYIPQSTQASALFTSNEACARYLKATRGGISNAFNDDDRIIQIELGTSPDPKVFSSDHHGSNRSRCIEITGSIIGWRDVEELEALASNHDCSIESLELRKKCKLANLEIRFLSIEHAQSFLAACKKEEKWSQLKIDFCADPCAIANGIHH